MKELITEKDFLKTKFKLSFAVVSNKGIVMSAGFAKKADAEKFRDKAHFGYYKDCSVRLVRTS